MNGKALNKILIYIRSSKTDDACLHITIHVININLITEINVHTFNTLYTIFHTTINTK